MCRVCIFAAAAAAANRTLQLFLFLSDVRIFLSRLLKDMHMSCFITYCYSIIIIDSYHNKSEYGMLV